MDIYRKFTAALESLGVRGGVIVAFSGGADSAYVMDEYAEDLEKRKLLI